MSQDLDSSSHHVLKGVHTIVIVVLRAEIVADMEKTSFQPIPESTILDWGEAIYEPAFQVGGGRQYRLVRLPRKVTADQARKEIRDKLMGWREKGRQGEK